MDTSPVQTRCVRCGGLIIEPDGLKEEQSGKLWKLISYRARCPHCHNEYTRDLQPKELVIGD